MGEVQTRSFDSVDSLTAMKAAIDMLQDGGFTIERTDAALGLVVGRQAVVRRPSGGLRALKYVGAAFSCGLIGLIPLNKTDELEARRTGPRPRYFSRMSHTPSHSAPGGFSRK